jgi:hypothetical protein
VIISEGRRGLRNYTRGSIQIMHDRFVPHLLFGHGHGHGHVHTSSHLFGP